MLDMDTQVALTVENSDEHAQMHEEIVHDVTVAVTKIFRGMGRETESDEFIDKVTRAANNFAASLYGFLPE